MGKMEEQDYEGCPTLHWGIYPLKAEAQAMQYAGALDGFIYWSTPGH